MYKYRINIFNIKQRRPHQTPVFFKKWLRVDSAWNLMLQQNATAPRLCCMLKVPFSLSKWILRLEFKVLSCISYKSCTSSWDQVCITASTRKLRITSIRINRPNKLQVKTLMPLVSIFTYKRFFFYSGCFPEQKLSAKKQHKYYATQKRWEQERVHVSVITFWSDCFSSLIGNSIGDTEIIK